MAHKCAPTVMVIIHNGVSRRPNAVTFKLANLAA
jgi:hypothetical protein